MRKLDIKTANDYMKNFDSTMKRLGVDSREKGFTKSVTFNRKQLQEWLLSLGPDTKEIKIQFAAYPSTTQKNKNLSRDESSAGRLTTLLWPCNEDGEPANEEDGNPEAIQK